MDPNGVGMVDQFGYAPPVTSGTFPSVTSGGTYSGFPPDLGGIFAASPQKLKDGLSKLLERFLSDLCIIRCFL